MKDQKTKKDVTKVEKPQVCKIFCYSTTKQKKQKNVSNIKVISPENTEAH